MLAAKSHCFQPTQLSPTLMRANLFCRQELHQAILLLVVTSLSSGDSPLAVGALLPALAASGRGLQLHAHKSTEAHRFSADVLQESVRDGSSVSKVLSVPPYALVPSRCQVGTDELCMGFVVNTRTCMDLCIWRIEAAFGAHSDFKYSV